MLPEILAEWSFQIAAHWQVAAGLRYSVKREHVIATLEMMARVSEPVDHPLARLLVRGLLLELVEGLRLSLVRVPDRERLHLQRLCDCICDAGRMTPLLRQRARDLAATLRNPPLEEDASLARRARAYIDALGGQRVTLASVAHAVGSNRLRVHRAFKRVYGVSVAEYERRRVAEAAVVALRMPIPLTKAARDLGCSEATIRRLIRQATGRSPSHLRPRA